MTSSVTDLCRLCGTDTFNIVRHHIFEAESLAKCIAKKIAECLPVNVTPQDRLPKHMCGECAYKLDLLSEFRDKAVKTEHLLESLVDGVKPEILENEEPDNDLGADDGFRSDSPDQPEPEVLIKEEDAEPRPERRPVRKAARKVGRPRGRKRKQTEIEPDTEEEVESEEAPKKAVKKEEAPPKVYRKRGRKPKNNKESPGCPTSAEKTREANSEAGGGAEPGLKCPHCGLAAATREQLQLHVRQGCSACTFICELCGKHVRSVKALVRHRIVHFPKTLECDFCKRTFHHKETISKHVRTHMNVRPYQCTYCTKNFKHANILNDHINVVHMGITKDAFPCVACSRTFCRRSHLERHMRVHTGERPYECTVCNAKFASSYNMRAHRASVHKIMPHVCYVCRFGARTRQALADHCLEAHGMYI